MIADIKDLAFSQECEDATKWTFTSYGSKVCGGPVGYIAYSTSIDKTLFLDKIAEHRIAQDQFNGKWGIISDCSIPQKPEDVVCEDGEAVFVY